MNGAILGPVEETFLGVSKTIGQLTVGHKRPVYRRADKQTWMNVTGSMQIQVEQGVDPEKKDRKVWIGKGGLKPVDASEVVEVLQDGESE